MAKKKSATTAKPTKPTSGKRIDRAAYGIDLPAVLETIRPRLAGTHAEIADRAGMSKGNVSNVLSGAKEPSLGHLAALARAAGGRIDVTFIPEKSKR
ncbi:helix-turn-helix domain-containing protein [Rhodopirellula bahusiensis]|uniref:HTH cro/C1-type domain-containing protein n=1 Tax=Rhodopirellula bahusiensis TaxID=2014065 RepID=A0A2G1W812_9BACT|nr:helix-turn-helix domain-containing protein [Rhodopirellula bahusiensis]PHQ35184.1 hypothetical protein CEE69_12295 [Rhodopirellula bahusiensis]